MKQRCIRRLALTALVMLSTLAARSAPAAEELITLQPRPGVTQSYLLTHEPGRTDQAVAVLLPGGDGHIGVSQSADGVMVRSHNFLVRARQAFLSAGIATAVMETPSDMPRFTDAMRMSAEHAADIRSVFQDMKRHFSGAKVFIVGTSRGTVSAAHAAVALGGEASGVALTSAVYRASRRDAGLSGFDFSTVKIPLVLVHHREDACPACPYSVAETLAKAKSFPLISVSGGLPPQSGPCEALSAHGYLGKESETVQAIAAWMLGASYAAEIR